MRTFSLLFVFALLSSFVQAQAAPVLFYTDIESGPASGGEGGKDGAFVCVYGENFGATRGSSSIALDGVEAAAYKVWTDPGAPYRPAHYAKACIQISARSHTGATSISVTTPHGASNRLRFTVAPGKIHFVAAKGSDAAGDGSNENPWQTVPRCKRQMSAGDICYVKDMTISKPENYGAALWLDSSGKPGSPKAIVAYPGARVIVDATLAPGLSRAVSNYKTGEQVSHWTLAGMVFDGPNIAVQIYPSAGIRLVDDEIQCTGPHCFGADGGLLIGGPGAVTSNVTVLGSRVHDVGCHDDPEYSFSAHPCTWVSAGKSLISTSGKNWSITQWTSSFGPGDVIQANGQLRRILTCDQGCGSGKLDAPFPRDLPAGTPWQWRFASPPKLFHTVYLGNTNSVEFAWNEIDGSKGQACRGLLFHSTAANDEYDLHIHDNDIHDTVCDCIALSTVDPNRGAVEVYNNTLRSCGTGSALVMQSSYAAVYVANAGDCLPNPGRGGAVKVFNNTIYDAGSGGTPGYNTACLAFQASASPRHGTAGLNASNNICLQRGVNGQTYVNVTGADSITNAPAAHFLSGSNNDCYGLASGCPPQLTRSLNASPDFMRPESADFRLHDASPLAHAGASDLVSNSDQNGQPRAAKPSIGALESVKPAH